MVQDMSFIKLGDDAADFVEADIAILAGVVNFLPHPNSPRTRSLGSKKFTNDARIAICLPPIGHYYLATN